MTIDVLLLEDEYLELINLHNLIVIKLPVNRYLCILRIAIQ